MLSTTERPPRRTDTNVVKYGNEMLGCGAGNNRPFPKSLPIFLEGKQSKAKPKLCIWIDVKKIPLIATVKVITGEGYRTYLHGTTCFVSAFARKSA